MDPGLPGQEQFCPNDSEQFRPHHPDQNRPHHPDQFRHKNAKPFGPRDLGLMGGMARGFKLKGRGSSVEENDARLTGRRNVRRDEQRDFGQNHEAAVEPRTKRSRWGENSDETPVEIDADEKKCATTSNNVDNSIQVSSVANIFEDKPLIESHSSNIQETIEPSIEIKPDSRQPFTDPDLSTLNTGITSKLEEPLIKETELPTQGPGDTDESFTKTEDSKASAMSSEEIVCDSTVD